MRRPDSAPSSSTGQFRIRPADDGLAGDRRFWLLAGAAFAAAAVLIALTSPLGGDYAQPGCTAAYACDDPAISIRALSHGDFHTFFALQPTMGAISLVVRAPFAALGKLLDDTDLTVYRLGVFALLAVAALVALSIAGVARSRLRVSVVAAVAFALVCVLNPVTFRTISWGHPEEILAAVLLGAAVVCAYLGEWRWAAVALGAAFGTKQWAALALPLLVLVVPAATRVRFTVLTAVVALVLVLPMYLGNTERFTKVTRRLSSDSAAATPTNVWWQETKPAAGGYSPGTRVPNELARRLSHPLIVGFALLLPLVWYRKRWDLLALVPVLMLLRCTLDWGSYSYYHDPLVIGLAVWELVVKRRVPWLAAAASVAVQLTASLAPHLSPGQLQAFYLTWTTALLAYLVWLAAQRAVPTVRRDVVTS